MEMKASKLASKFLWDTVFLFLENTLSVDRTALISMQFFAPFGMKYDLKVGEFYGWKNTIMILSTIYW